MSESEFLEWQRGQELRYELVDGIPQAMTGAKVRHDIVRGNAEAYLRPLLRNVGSGCLPFGSDIGIRVFPGQLRRPDISIICPPFDLDAMVSETPHMVLEALSDSTRRIDEYVKLEEYKALNAMNYIVLMSAVEVDLAVWSRDHSRDWERTRYRSISDVIPLPMIGVKLPLSILYEGLEGVGAFPN